MSLKLTGWMENCVLNMGTVVVAFSFASSCFDCGKPNSTLGDQRPELEYVSSIEAAVLVITWAVQERRKEEGPLGHF